MMKYLNCLMAVVLALLVFETDCQERFSSAVVTVNCGKTVGPLRRSELYNNNSLLRVPRKEVTDKYLDRLGKTRIMRCWLTLNDCWVPESDTFNFDFPVGWGFNLWSNYYDYIDRFSAISEEVLLNVRGNHEKVVNGEISIQQWKAACKKAVAHYKLRIPNIRYIEALNEYDGGGFGGLTNDQYYTFYQVFYELVNEINEELKPEIPLLIGGPCIMGGPLSEDCSTCKKTKMLAFLDNYAKDKSPGKKLDFLSYHQYNDTKEDPSSALGHEALIKSWLAERDLPVQLPVFINEMGCFAGSRTNGCTEDDLFITACNIASLFYYYNQQNDMQGFHWVVQHKTNDRKTQILDDLRWTPYGISLILQHKLKDNKLETFNSGIKNGKGVYAEASTDGQTVTVLVWNYQWVNQESFDTQLIINALPDLLLQNPVQLTVYQLDREHNNFLNSDAYYWNSNPDQDLVHTKKEILSPSAALETRIVLPPNGMALFELAPAK